MSAPMFGARLVVQRLLVCVALVALGSTAGAERLMVKTYGTADGLPHDAVHRVVQDSRGFLWFCTRDGLSRFDGYRFTNYGVEHGLPSAMVYDVLEARDGVYWIGTQRGLARFQPHAQRTSAGARAVPAGAVLFRSEPLGGPNSPPAVQDLIQDRSGVIWAGTDSGLYRLTVRPDRVDAASVDIDPATPRRRSITSFAEGRYGVLWVGTGDGVYRRRVDGQFEKLDLPSIAGVVATRLSREGLAVHSVLVDREDRLWIATRFLGLFRVAVDSHSPQGSVLDHYSTASALPTNWVNDLVQTADGAVWAGTNHGLLQLLPQSAGQAWRVRAYSRAHGVPDHEVLAVTEDRHRNLWIGTVNGGAGKLWHRGLTKYEGADGLGWATSLVETPRGELVIGGGPDPSRWFLNRFDGERFVPVGPVLPGVAWSWGWNQTLFQDRDGDWWIGMNLGLYRFRHVRRVDDLPHARPFAVYTSRDGLAGPIIRIFEDSRGDVWVGSLGYGKHGLSRWQRSTGRFHHYDVPPLTRHYVSAFAEDRAGNIWMGFSGTGGLARYRDGALSVFSSGDGVPAGRITNLLVDSRGYLWAATDRAGVCRVDEPTADRLAFITYTTANGLSSNVASAVVEDRWGRIHIGTGRGLDTLDPTTGRIRRYASASGVPAGTMAALRDREGVLWFTSGNGVVRFVPTQEAPLLPAPVLITDVRMGPISHPISAIGEHSVPSLSLAADDNQLQVEFVALGYGPGEELRYQYRLDGTDEEWSVPTPQRSVNYARLAPGAYRFVVRAVNADGVLSETSATLPFTVRPPFWQQWWFLTFAGVLLAGGVYAAHRIRLNRLLEVLAIRQGIATDLHDDVGANLARIAILSEVARQQSGNGGRPHAASLERIARIARESASGMSDIVWAISPERDSLEDLVRRMREHVEDVFAARNAGVRFEAPDAGHLPKLSSVARRDLYLIFKEAINNAARHSACSRVTITFRVDGQWIDLRVTDDGRGFEASSDGHGEGLRSMRRRADRLGAALDIETAQGRGTTVRVTAMLHRRRSARRQPTSIGR
jgi:ligand-binding sensor domain-containing protein/signal transduction histidine kinase